MMQALPQMITANRLRDGEVVWWNAGRWVEMLSDGEVFSDSDAAKAALIKALVFVNENVVVNPYLFQVRLQAGALHPVEEREIVRALGPSVAKNYGKQARHVPV
jgi:hypothetical protein